VTLHEAEKRVCQRCGRELPHETKKGPARKYHPECADALRLERDRARMAERKSPRRAP
jgi:hypothetical protein